MIETTLKTTYHVPDWMWCQKKDEVQITETKYPSFQLAEKEFKRLTKQTEHLMKTKGYLEYQPYDEIQLIVGTDVVKTWRKEEHQ